MAALARCHIVDDPVQQKPALVVPEARSLEARHKHTEGTPESVRRCWESICARAHPDLNPSQSSLVLAVSAGPKVFRKDTAKPVTRVQRMAGSLGCGRNFTRVGRLEGHQ